MSQIAKRTVTFVTGNQRKLEEVGGMTFSEVPDYPLISLQVKLAQTNSLDF